MHYDPLFSPWVVCTSLIMQPLCLTKEIHAYLIARNAGSLAAEAELHRGACGRVSTIDKCWRQTL